MIAVVDIDTLQILDGLRWSRMPKQLVLANGDIVCPPYLGLEDAGRRLVELVEIDAYPGDFHHRGGLLPSLDSNVLTIAREYTAMTQAEIDAEIARRAAAREADRDNAAAEMDAIESVTRAAVLVIMDELNRHSSKITELGQAIVSGSSLADIKSRVTAIQPIAQRTGEDLKQAIRAKLGAA